MTAVPTVHVFVPGEVATAANINLYGTAANFLLARPIIEMNQTVSQSIASNSGPGSALTFTTEVVDSSNMHSTVTNTSRATAVYPGYYRFGGGSSFAANATGSRGTIGFVNGTNINGSMVYGPATPSGLWSGPARTKLYFLNVGDFFELNAIQSSGGALSTSVSNIEQPNMTGAWESN